MIDGRADLGTRGSCGRGVNTWPTPGETKQPRLGTIKHTASRSLLHNSHLSLTALRTTHSQKICIHRGLLRNGSHLYEALCGLSYQPAAFTVTTKERERELVRYKGHIISKCRTALQRYEVCQCLIRNIHIHIIIIAHINMNILECVILSSSTNCSNNKTTSTRSFQQLHSK